jgi:hypothetical protein
MDTVKEDSICKDYDPDSLIRCVAGTMAIEGIELSRDSIHNIEKYASGQESYEHLLREIIEKYKR